MLKLNGWKGILPSLLGRRHGDMFLLKPSEINCDSRAPFSKHPPQKNKKRILIFG